MNPMGPKRALYHVFLHIALSYALPKGIQEGTAKYADIFLWSWWRPEKSQKKAEYWMNICQVAR